MHGRDVGQKLSYVIACTKFFGSLSLNVNERTKTVQSMPRRRALAMAFAIACIFILNITPFETAYEQYKQTLSKMVFRNYLLITNVNCIFVVVEWIVNKDQVEVLWRSLLNLDKSCEPLSLKCRLRKRTMMSIVGTSAVFHVLFSAVDTWRSADRNSWFSVTLSLSVLVFCGIKGITVVQFAALLTIYKNYFAQINRVLFNILDFPAEHRANVVKSALVSHQQFYELTLLTTKVSAFPIILLLSDTIIVLSAYLYVFVQTLQEYPLTVSLAWQICYVINTVIIVVIVLLPSELCMHHVSKGIYILHEYKNYRSLGK